MKRNRQHPLTVVLLCLLCWLATGCGDERTDLEAPAAEKAMIVTATIPHDGQYSVTLTSKIVIYFSQAIDPNSLGDKIVVRDGHFLPVDVTTEVYGQSLIITAASHWQERMEYLVTLAPGIRSHLGYELEQEKEFTFETAVRYPKAAERLEVVRVDPGPEDACWDFHTFRLFFNEPVARTSLDYGTAIRMTDKETGELVEGNLFARGGQVVFDPDEDLTPGREYLLTVATTLLDYNGQGLAEPYEITYVPKSTGKRTLLAMDHCPTAVDGEWFCTPLADDESFPRSSLIDYPTNSVYTKSVFLGGSTMLIGGRLWQEFAESSVAPDRIPFVVRKGQKIIGNPLQYMVGGVIPSGIHTGEITITLLADAIGEMSGSEFVHGEEGLPATIRLTLDTAMGFESTTANSLMPQPLLGTVLVGQASVGMADAETGYEAMQIEMTGFAELNLGNEFFPASMSLKMIPPPTLPTATGGDTEPPLVRSVAPVDFEVEGENIAEHVDRRFLEEPIVVYFNEPVDPSSIAERIYLLGPEGRVAGTYDNYAPKVWFLPETPLLPDSDYQVVVEAGITDIAGNALATTSRYNFHTGPYQSSPVEPPVVAASVPGPIADNTMACNFFPEFYFTQMIDPETLVNGVTFGLYDTEEREMVPGTLYFYPLFFDFVMDEELTEGRKYVWFITEQVANYDGVALDTDMDGVPGGRTLAISFTATAFSPFSQTAFTTYPYADADVNGFLEAGETVTLTNYMEMDSSMIEEPAYVMGYFPVNVHELTYGTESEPQLEVDIEPGNWQFGTNLSVSLFKAETGLFDMGRMTIQIMAPSSTDIFQGEDGLMASYVDAHMNFNVENSLLNSFLVHDMFLQMPSVMRYSKDGRMVSVIEGNTVSGMAIPILGVMEIPVYVNMTSCTVPTNRGY